jgi:1-phosphofructokinase
MILTVTLNPAVDQTLQFDEPLAPDRVMRAEEARFDAGGKGINVAQFLAGMDRACVATGLVGGFTGQFVRDRLADDSIPTDFVEADGPTRLNTSAIADGVEYKLNHDGPVADDDDIEAIVEVVRRRDPDTVVVGGSLPPGVTTDAVDAIAAAGEWETIVDMDGPQLTALAGQYALCAPNDVELADALGRELPTVEACAEAAQTFRAEGFDRVLASLGDAGALLVTESTTLFAEPLETDVVDTVGAGDALLSGVVAAWADGADDELALRTGVALATLVVGRAGPTVPDREAVRELRERVTVRTLDNP